MRKKTFEEVKQLFKDKECELLSDSYGNSYEKLLFKCKCGNVSEICFNQFCKSPQCRNCGLLQMKKSKDKGQQPCRICGLCLDREKSDIVMDRKKYGNICRPCYNKNHAEFQKANGWSYYIKHNEKRLEYLAKRREEYPDLVRAQSNASYHKTRIEVLKHYSPNLCCVKCNFDKHMAALSIDHIHGNGNKHRKEIANANMYRWLKNNNFPEGFQVLCMNCQFIKRYTNKECTGSPKKPIKNVPSD